MIRSKQEPEDDGEVLMSVTDVSYDLITPISDVSSGHVPTYQNIKEDLELQFCPNCEEDDEQESVEDKKVNLTDTVLSVRGLKKQESVRYSIRHSEQDSFEQIKCISKESGVGI